jgi:hypothetical protein
MGVPAYPMPQILMEPKHAGGGFDRTTGRIDSAVASIGRRKGEKDKHGNPIQRDVFGRRAFISTAGDKIEPDFRSRMRTAVDNGRAALGQLFGYEHIEPAETQYYAATIEVDDGTFEDGTEERKWQQLLETFEGQSLRLGRAAGTFYGGAYYCEVYDGAGEDLWPATAVPSISAGTQIRVWVLSDLALVDRFGAPCFVPTPGMLGLPEAGRLQGSDSAISVRRYAPWNRKLGSRDAERQVIAAGSVFTFTYDDAAAMSGLGPGAVGLWRETGLGRIWVAPPMLTGVQGTAPTLDPQARSITDGLGSTFSKRTGERKSSPDDGPDLLVAWMKAIDALTASALEAGQ